MRKAPGIEHSGESTFFHCTISGDLSAVTDKENGKFLQTEINAS